VNLESTLPPQPPALPSLPVRQGPAASSEGLSVRIPLASAAAWQAIEVGGWFEDDALLPSALAPPDNAPLPPLSPTPPSPPGVPAPGPMQRAAAVPPSPVLYRSGDLAVQLPSGRGSTSRVPLSTEAI
jgi:hypothetical protein